MDSGPSGQEQNQQSEDETPPSAASTVGLMAVGGAPQCKDYIAPCPVR